jgi:hypothetical protein
LRQEDLKSKSSLDPVSRKKNKILGEEVGKGCGRGEYGANTVYTCK